MKKSLLMVILVDIILYIIQFLIIPLNYNNVIGRGTEGGVVFLITTILVTVIGMLMFSNKIHYWLLGIILYFLLIVLYCPRGAYGIGIVGIDLDGLQSRYDANEKLFGIVIFVIFVMLLQSVIWCLIKLFKWIISKL